MKLEFIWLYLFNDCCNESVNAYFWVFMKEIFHLLMYKYIHKPIHHTHTPKIP